MSLMSDGCPPELASSSFQSVTTCYQTHSRFSQNETIFIYHLVSRAQVSLGQGQSPLISCVCPLSNSPFVSSTMNRNRRQAQNKMIQKKKAKLNRIMRAIAGADKGLCISQDRLG